MNGKELIKHAAAAFVPLGKLARNFWAETQGYIPQRANDQEHAARANFLDTKIGVIVEAILAGLAVSTGNPDAAIVLALLAGFNFIEGSLSITIANNRARHHRETIRQNPQFFAQI